jgi:hypothetical protein
MFTSAHFRYITVAFFLTVILIFAVHLRNANNHIFYELCMYRSEISQLQQELGARQLQLESLINPAAISRRLSQMKPGD